MKLNLWLLACVWHLWTVTGEPQKEQMVRFHPITYEEYERLMGITEGDPVISEARLINSGFAGLAAGLTASGFLPTLLSNFAGGLSSLTRTMLKEPDGYPLCVIRSEDILREKDAPTKGRSNHQDDHEGNPSQDNVNGHLLIEPTDSERQNSGYEGTEGSSNQNNTKHQNVINCILVVKQIASNETQEQPVPSEWPPQPLYSKHKKPSKHEKPPVYPTYPVHPPYPVYPVYPVHPPHWQPPPPWYGSYPPYYGGYPPYTSYPGYPPYTGYPGYYDNQNITQADTTSFSQYSENDSEYTIAATKAKKKNKNKKKKKKKQRRTTTSAPFYSSMEDLSSEPQPEMILSHQRKRRYKNKRDQMPVHTFPFTENNYQNHSPSESHYHWENPMQNRDQISSHAQNHMQHNFPGNMNYHVQSPDDSNIQNKIHSSSQVHEQQQLPSHMQAPDATEEKYQPSTYPKFDYHSHYPKVSYVHSLAYQAPVYVPTTRSSSTANKKRQYAKRRTVQYDSYDET